MCRDDQKGVQIKGIMERQCSPVPACAPPHNGTAAMVLNIQRAHRTLCGPSTTVSTNPALNTLAPIQDYCTLQTAVFFFFFNAYTKVSIPTEAQWLNYGKGRHFAVFLPPFLFHVSHKISVSSICIVLKCLIF